MKLDPIEYRELQQRMERRAARAERLAGQHNLAEARDRLQTAACRYGAAMLSSGGPTIADRVALQSAAVLYADATRRENR